MRYVLAWVAAVSSPTAASPIYLHCNANIPIKGWQDYDLGLNEETNAVTITTASGRSFDAEKVVFTPGKVTWSTHVARASILAQQVDRTSLQFAMALLADFQDYTKVTHNGVGRCTLVEAKDRKF